jgi:hypothetical protein
MTRVAIIQTTDLGAALSEPEAYPIVQFDTLDITPSFWNGDTVQVVAKVAAVGAASLVPNALIWLPDEGNKLFIIEHVETELDGTTRVASLITASGRSFDGFIDTERIIVPATDYDTQTSVVAETAIKHYVNASAGSTATATRQIPNFQTVADSARGGAVTLQARYRTLGSTMRHIGYLAGMGWYSFVDTTTGLVNFDVIVPTDRTATVILDFDLQTIDEWNDKQDLLNASTVTYVGGQGYLAQRTVVIRFQAGEPAGLSRREAFVPAGDLASTDTAGLNARGDAFLAANAPLRVTSATVTPAGMFQPDVDFFMGDLVTMTDTETGALIADRVTKWKKHYDFSVVAPSYIISVGKPFPGADPEDVAPGVAVSDTTVVASLVAGLITAGSITTGSITADKFNATLALVSKIIAGTAGSSRIELDKFGFRAYDLLGNQTIYVPTDGSASTFTGAIIAATLEATGQVTVDAGLSLSKTATGTLQAGVLAPGSAPVLSTGWPTLQDATYLNNAQQGSSARMLYKDPVGGAGGATPVYLCYSNDFAGNSYIDEIKASDLSLDRRTNITSNLVLPTGYVDAFGYPLGAAIFWGTRLGTNWYFIWMLQKVSDSTYHNFLAQIPRGGGAGTFTDLSVKVTGGDNTPITTDGTNLFIWDASTGAGLYKYNSSGVWQSTVTLTAPGGLHNTSQYSQAITWDGTNFWAGWSDGSIGTPGIRYYAYATTGGAAVANRDFPIELVTGSNTNLFWDSTLGTFIGAGFGGTSLIGYTAWDWTTASAKYWVGVAWYDDAGTVHETAIGPRSSIVMDRRQQLTITTTAIPVGGADDPDTVRVYMLPFATAPAPGAFWLQVTDALTNRVLTNYTGSGTHDGAGTAFPGGAGAILRSADSAGFILKGNGVIGFKGTSNPSTGVAGDRYFRDDLDAMVHYDVAKNSWTGGAHQAFQSGDVVAASGSLADLTGMTVTVGQGTWLVTVTCYITVLGSGTTKPLAVFILLADGSQVGTQEGIWAPAVIGGGPGSGDATVTQTWLVTIAAGATGLLKVQGDKTNTNSTFTFRATHSNITAIPVH